MHVTPPPESEEILWARAQAIAGLTFKEIARQWGERVPENSLHAKGWIGGLLERVLGADAANLSEPDFQQIGVELKTLPVNIEGRPLESTYVCTAPLDRMIGQIWQTSSVRKKLARMLWIPVQGERAQPMAERRIGNPLLWSPSPSQEAVLRQDWEELVERLSLGQGAMITASMGQYLHIRPKAAHSRILCDTLDESGEVIKTVPKGFYLRRCFTEAILREYYVSSQ